MRSAAELVYEWSGSGAADHVDLTIGDERVLAVTRRTSQSFGPFVIRVTDSMGVAPEAYVTASEPLALPAMITPEVLLLERVSIEVSGGGVSHEHATAPGLAAILQ